MQAAAKLFHRATNSAVIWSWAFNILRLASGLLLLPLLIHQLTKPDFGMYYLLLSVIGLTPIIDFGFSGAIARFVSYAMAGATQLQAQGYSAPPAQSSGPNLQLLWSLLLTTRKLYRVLALVGMLVMGVWGTILVYSKVGETEVPAVTWLAWGLTLAAASLDIYSIWWNTFLYSMNRVKESARIQFISYAVRISLACALLVLNADLLSMPIASIIGCLLNRSLSRRACLRELGRPVDSGAALTGSSLLHLLWPTSWRTGVQYLSTYLRTNASTAICVATFGLAATAEYGLSVQVMTIAMGMAGVWTSVKWPMVNQLRSSQNLAGLRALVWPRLWLQILTFSALAIAAIVIGPAALKWFSADKQMMSSGWLWVLALVSLLDMNFIFWSTLLAAENRIPTLWPTVATNLASLVLALVLSNYTSLGVASLVLAPLLAGLVFNYWHWPRVGAKNMGTCWSRFTFSRP